MRIILRLLCIVIAFSQQASAVDLDGEWLQMKSAIEGVYEKKIGDSLLTQLAKDQFALSISFDLARIEVSSAVSQSDNPSLTPFMPTLMGTIQADELIKVYDEKIKHLKDKTNQSILDKLKGYKIRAAQVRLGLKESVFSPEYQRTLSAWLKQRISKDLQIPAAIDITKIVEPKAEPPKAEQPKRWTELLKDLEVLILGILICVACTVCAVLWFVQRNRELKHKQERDRVSDEQKAMETTLVPSETPVEKTAQAAEQLLRMGPLDAEGFSENRHKLGQLLETLGETKVQFLSKLASGAKLEQKKACVLIDAWLHYWTQNQNGKNAITDLDWKQYLQGIYNFRYHLMESIEELKRAEPAEIKKLIEESYWDLLAFRTVGGKFSTKPLGYVRNLTFNELTHLFLKLDLKAQAYLFMNLQPHQKNHIKNSLEEFVFLAVMRKQVDLIFLTSTELELLIEQIDSVFNELFGAKVSLLEKFQHSLAYIPHEEEKRFLTESRSKFSAMGVDVRTIVRTIGFFNEWKAEAKKIFIESLSPEQLTVLILSFPEEKEFILMNCSEFQAKLVKDDLEASGYMLDERARESRRFELNQKLSELIDSGKIEFNTIYQEEGRIYAIKSAS